MVRPSAGAQAMGTTRSEDLMTAQDLASHLGVKPGTVLHWHRQGKIPARRLSHKVLRFNLREILAALEAPCQDAPRQGGNHVF
jgi:hypothetical protein